VPTPGHSPEQRFAERMGLYFETSGGTRIMGLVYGWLIVCVPAHVSITELARVLGVSKASVSTTVRQLESADMVERVPVPGTRQHHYQLRGGGWTQVLRTRFVRMAPIVAAADEMLSRPGNDDESRVKRLEELRDFFKFVEVDTDALTERWEAYRKRAMAERADAAGRSPGRVVGSRG
jgi:DNA-binding transcriptional regulator GbsR (MarR family)